MQLTCFKLVSAILFCKRWSRDKGGGSCGKTSYLSPFYMLSFEKHWLVKEKRWSNMDTCYRKSSGLCRVLSIGSLLSTLVLRWRPTLGWVKQHRPGPIVVFTVTLLLRNSRYSTKADIRNNTRVFRSSDGSQVFSNDNDIYNYFYSPPAAEISHSLCNFEVLRSRVNTFCVVYVAGDSNLAS